MTITTLDADRADLLAQLAAVRATLTNTARGLTDEQAGLRPTVSALCVGGLIKHVTTVEQAWMRFVLEGPSAMSYELPEGVTWDDFMSGTATAYPQWAIDRHHEFQMLPGDTVAAIIERYEHAAARTDEIVAGLPDLSISHPLPEAPWHEAGETRSARRVLLHVIAETAQHAGHAEILRESIDGRTTT
ncbi:conserved hypothetical protein [metagenome]|uniref:Mini-circle protein n=1 Tax=metagenome TaxID=256318 RepID=A0A2P2CB56_9ZZZZ